MRQVLWLLFVLFLAVSTVMADDSSSTDSSDSATSSDDSSSSTDSSDSASTTDDSASSTDPSDSASTTDDSSSTSYLEATTSRVSITAASSESASSTTGSVSMPGLTTTTTTTTTTSATSSSTSSTSSASTTSFSYTPTIPTSSTENPFITQYTVPEGTVFIAVGSIIGGLLLAGSAWRAALWYSMRRSAQKEAPYYEDSKLGLFPIDNDSSANFVTGGSGSGNGGIRPYSEYRGGGGVGDDYSGNGGLYFSSAFATSKSSVDNLPPPNTARVHSGLYYSPILEAATRHSMHGGDHGLPISEVGFSTPVGYHSPAMDSAGGPMDSPFLPPMSIVTNNRSSRSQRPPSTVLNNVLSDNVPLNPPN